MDLVLDGSQEGKDRDCKVPEGGMQIRTRHSTLFALWEEVGWLGGRTLPGQKMTHNECPPAIVSQQSLVGKK